MGRPRTVRPQLRRDSLGSRAMHSTRLLLWSATLAFAACASPSSTQRLQRQLERELAWDSVAVELHGSALFIVFRDSDGRMLGNRDRAALFARYVAEYVRDHWRDYGGLARIDIGFSRALHLPVGTARRFLMPPDALYGWTVHELGPPRPGPTGAPEPHAAA